MTETPRQQSGSADQDHEAASAGLLAELLPRVISLHPKARAHLARSLNVLFGEPGGQRTPGSVGQEEPDQGTQPERQYRAFADLLNDATGAAKSEQMRALVAGYWIQECLGKDSFQSGQMNHELRAVGRPISNITKSVTRLERRKPALIYQSGKIGSGKRPRKLLKLSAAGVEAVERMLAADSVKR